MKKIKYSEITPEKVYKNRRSFIKSIGLGASSYALRVVDNEPADDGFADNINIETEADAIIDFSERNPFGIP